jgi:hypothetical protein
LKHHQTCDVQNKKMMLKKHWKTEKKYFEWGDKNKSFLTSKN